MNKEKITEFISFMIAKKPLFELEAEQEKVVSKLKEAVNNNAPKEVVKLFEFRNGMLSAAILGKKF